MYHAEITDRYIEPPNVKEFTYNELLRDTPLPDSVVPIVYPGEDSDGKTVFVRPSQSKTYAQLAIYNELSYKSTTPGLYLVDQVPPNTNVDLYTRYRTQILISLFARGLGCFDELKPIKAGDFFWLVGTESYKLNGVTYEPADTIVFTQDCPVGTPVTESMFKQMKNFKMIKTTYGKERGYKELRIVQQTLYIPSIDSYWKYNEIESNKATNTYDVLTVYLPKHPTFGYGMWYEPVLRFFPIYS